MSPQKKKLRSAVDEKIKRDICEAARRLFLRARSGPITMALIARESGIPRGTIYYYFKNKAALITHLIHRATEPYEARAETIANSDMSALDKLAAITELNMNMTSETRGFFSLLAHNSEQAFLQTFAQDATIQSHSREVSRITKIIKMGLDEGVFQDIPIEDITTAYFGLTTLFIKRRIDGKSTRSSEQDTKMLVKILTEGICTSASKAKNKKA